MTLDQLVLMCCESVVEEVPGEIGQCRSRVGRMSYVLYSDLGTTSLVLDG